MIQTNQNQKKKSDNSELVKKLDYKAKISEIEKTIPNISGLSKNV